MVYPRQCPRCETDYARAGVHDTGHVTLRAEPGGTPSPWRPNVPGRLLLLRCGFCRQQFLWDYFASAPAAEALRPFPDEDVQDRSEALRFSS